MTFPSTVDIAIIGAGAAGLAAATTLRGLPVSTLVLEARDRLGGRAWTVTTGGYPVDLGCGWLHSADKNPFVAIARRLGFTVDRSMPPWEKRAFAANFPEEDQRAYRIASHAFYERLDRAAREPLDRPADTLLEPGNRWNGMLDAVSTYINGAELDRVSIKDWDNYADTEQNWRLPAGYGALIAAYGSGVPVALETPVTAIDHSRALIRIETPRGVLSARAVIITVPPSVIDAITFRPALPEKLEAAAMLPLGLADKLHLALDDAEAFPVDGRLYGRTDDVAIGSHHLRPFGRPMIEVYFGGRHARELEAAGDGAFAASAIDELVTVLGSDIRGKVRPLAVSGWFQDPFARGSYSHALPGHSGARATLAAPLDSRLFFAGEATSTHDFSTAHGAYRTGLRAAHEALEAIGIALPPSAP